MRKKIVAGNWKMNLTKSEALKLYSDISEQSTDGVIKMVFSPSLFLDGLKQNESSEVAIGAQNFYPEEKGAFTGEISYSQLLDMGIDTVLIGHSERRMLFGETNEMIQKKVNVAIEKGMKVMFCCGEPLEVREAEKHVEYVLDQLQKNIFQLSETQFKQVMIAYEPIWAIGTGKTATPEQANDMHDHIRLSIAQQYSNYLAENTPILYGGSCNPKNAKELFSQPHIDGGLIGGASLKTEDFIQIAKSF